MRLLASSLDNFIILNNRYSADAPFVTFRVTNPSAVTITISEYNNPDGYRHVIEGASGNVISSESFNTSGVAVLSLLECLKQIPIFYGIILQSSDTIRAYIETSIRYSINVTGSGIAVGGSYSAHIPVSPNKAVLMVRTSKYGDVRDVTMEKYTTSPTVSFNVTAPFSETSDRYPTDVTFAAYQVWDNTVSLLDVPFSSATIMPTTLSKFQDVDYNEYLYQQSGRTKFLTTSMTRRYNYGDSIGLSVLTTVPLTLKKDYYTCSGFFLESQTDCIYTEVNGVRTDFYDVFDLEHVEARHNKQVGYVDVFAMDGDDEATVPVRYNVHAKCAGGQEVFFINEIGGVDSFTFNGISSVQMQIDDMSTYKVNPINAWGDTKSLERVKRKRNEVIHTLRSGLISQDEAEWLNQLTKSKFAYFWLGTVNPKYMEIVVDKVENEYDSRGDGVEVVVQYHNGDNNMQL